MALRERALLRRDSGRSICPITISILSAIPSKCSSLSGPASCTIRSPEARNCVRSSESKMSATARGAGARRIRRGVAFWSMVPFLETVSAASRRSGPWHDRQDQSRGMCSVMNDGVLGRCELLRVRCVVPGVGVSVEARKIAAGDFKAQAMSLAEYVGCRPQVDIEFVSLAGFQEFRRLLRIAIPGAHDALGQVLGKAVRCHVHQFGDEIGVDCGRPGK